MKKQPNTSKEELKNIFTTKRIILLTIALSLVPVLDILQRVFWGDFAFWYDPARDMLSALANLQKPSLIGPTSGIPGVFYGPYWIWLLSFGQLFSQDPRIANFIVSTIPYLFIFPFVLSRFSQVFRPTTIAVLWMLFLLNYSNYFTDMWNPHPAPLLLLGTIYLLFIAKLVGSKRNMLLMVLAGFTAGLLVNFHLSLGIGMMFGILMYFAIAGAVSVFKSKHKGQGFFNILATILLFGFGFLAAFGPYLLFEIRHQFQQTQAFMAALFSYGGVVTLPGLSQTEILSNFIERGANLLSMPITLFSIVLLTLIGVHGVYIYRHGKNSKEFKLLAIILSLFAGIAFIYFTAKNPIWEYHFIAIEILFLMLLGLVIDKTKWIKAAISIWIVILVVINTVDFSKGLFHNPKNNTGTLAAKQNVVQGIVADAGKSDYTFYSLNPSIYMYDYSYLFKQIADKDISYDPGNAPKDPDTVYLIIPPESKNVQDFINFRAPKESFGKVSEHRYPDATLVLKYTRIQ